MIKLVQLFPIKDHEGNKQDLTNKKEMEDAIIKENRKKYHHTESMCPFLQEPLLWDFGELADGPCINQLMHNRYTPPDNIDEYT